MRINQCGKANTPDSCWRVAAFAFTAKVGIPGGWLSPFVLIHSGGRADTAVIWCLIYRVPPFRKERGRMGHPLLC
jgi:hypothetical protein